MSTLTKEWLLKTIAELEEERDAVPGAVNEDAFMALAAMKIALASLKAEPVAWDYELASYITCEGPQKFKHIIEREAPTEWAIDEGRARNIVPLYTAPPAPVAVPDFKPVGFLFVSDDGAIAYSPADWPMKGFNLIGQIYGDLNACRAAMLQGAEPDFREISNSSTKHFRENAETSTKCWCRTCRPVTFADSHFVVCPECGNKRCPHANDHRHACTGSNEPGQEGSAYPAAPQQEVK